MRRLAQPNVSDLHVTNASAAMGTVLVDPIQRAWVTKQYKEDIFLLERQFGSHIPTIQRKHNAALVGGHSV